MTEASRSARAPRLAPTHRDRASMGVGHATAGDPAVGQVQVHTPAELIALARQPWSTTLGQASAWAQDQTATAGGGLVVLTQRSSAWMNPVLAAREDLLVLQAQGPWPVGLLLEIGRDIQLVLDVETPGPEIMDAVGIFSAVGFPAAHIGLLSRSGASQEVPARGAGEMALGRRSLLRPFLRHRSLPEAQTGEPTEGLGSSRMSEVLKVRNSGGRVGVSMSEQQAMRSAQGLWAAVLVDDLVHEVSSPGSHGLPSAPSSDTPGSKARAVLLGMPRLGQRLRASGCVGSGTCVTVCPMGALDRPLAAGSFTLHWDGAACVECGICVEHCPEDALTLGPDASWGDALGIDLARGNVSECARCHMPHGRPGTLCGVCEFRRENPSGMWLPPGFVRPGR